MPGFNPWLAAAGGVGAGVEECLCPLEKSG